MTQRSRPRGRRGFLARIVPAALGLLILAVYGSAQAQESTERILIPAEKFGSASATEGETGVSGEEGRRFNFERFRSRIDGLWFKRKALLSNNLVDPAAEQLDAIQELCDEVGVGRLEAVAAALVREGHSYLDEGNLERATRSFQDSLRFDPGLPDAHFGLAKARWKEGSPLGATAEAARGMRSLLSSRTLSAVVLGNGLIIVLLAVVATAILFSIAMLVRYNALLRHDLKEYLTTKHPDRYPREAIALFGWGLVFLPVFTWVAALWAPAYWLMLTFRYQRALERTLSAVLLFLFLLSAPAARAAEFLFALASDPSARLMIASATASYDPEQVVNLEERAEANPDDPVYRFLLGSLYTRGRYFEDALRQYQKVVELDATSYRAFNNIGNIHLRTGRSEEALKNYKEALSLKPDFLLAYYNSYLARQSLFQLREAEQALKDGQALDPEGMAAIVSEARTRGAGEPAEALVDREEIARRILGEERARASIVGSVASVPSIAAAIFLVGSLGLTLILRKRSARCVKCGAAFCHRCKFGKQAPEYCSQCEHIYLIRDGLAPAARREKLLAAERFRRRLARVCRLTSIVVPGMGRLLDGRTLTGIVLAAGWSASILALLLRPRLLPLPNAGSVRPLFVVTVVLGLAAATAWAIGNSRAVRDASAPAGSWRWR